MSQDKISESVINPSNNVLETLEASPAQVDETIKTGSKKFVFFRTLKYYTKFIVSTRSKVLVIIISSLLMMVLAVFRTPQPITRGTDVLYDDSWIMGLPAELQQGHLSGRDFWINQGPLWQLISLIGVKLNKTGSSFDGYSAIALSLTVFSIVLLAFTIGLIKQLNWKYTLFLYVAITLLLPLPSSRWVSTVLCAVMLSRSMSTPILRKQVLWSILLGIAMLLAQLITAELGIYAFVTSAAVLGLYSLLSYFKERLNLKGVIPVKNSLIMLGAITLTYIGANFLISLFFLLSSSNYSHLFDYQLYILEIMRGYNYTFGALNPWPLSGFANGVLVLLIIFTIGFVLLSIRLLPASDGYLLTSLTVCSLIQLKSSLIRSDFGHIVLAFTPLIFTFLIIAKYRQIKSWTALTWVTTFILLISIWPTTSLESLIQLRSWVDGTYSFTGKLNQTLNVQIPQSKILPEGLRKAVDSGKTILNFPSSNFISIALNQPFIAPIHLATGAHTTALQQKYIEMLDKQKNNLEIIYGLDFIEAPPFENVQHITRVPIIFDYIYQNYELKYPQEFGKGYLVLKPRVQPAKLEGVELAFSTKNFDKQQSLIQFKEAPECSIVQLTSKISYPILSLVGRPTQTNLKFKMAGATLQEYNIVPIEVGKEFSTYVSLTGWGRFLRVFSNNLIVPTLKWDSILVSPAATDFPSVAPDKIEINKIKCINFARG